MNDFINIIENLEVGKKDPDGDKVKDIFCRTSTFVIYKTVNNKINPIYVPTPEMEKNVTRMSVAVNEIVMSNYGKFLRKNYISNEIARAMAEYLSGNYEEGDEIVLAIKSKLIRLRELYGRFHYLLSSFIFTTIIIALYYLSKQFKIDDLQLYLKICALGCIGGSLSEALRLKTINLETDASIFINLFAGISRMVVSVLCSASAYILIKGNIALGFIKDSNSPNLLNAILLLAGFSETLIPNVLNKIENKKADERSDG